MFELWLGLIGFHKKARNNVGFFLLISYGVTKSKNLRQFLTLIKEITAHRQPLQTGNKAKSCKWEQFMKERLILIGNPESLQASGSKFSKEYQFRCALRQAWENGSPVVLIRIERGVYLDSVRLEHFLRQNQEAQQ